jgi:hypothetical protein
MMAHDSRRVTTRQFLVAHAPKHAFHRCETGVLQVQQLRAADIGCEYDVEAGQIKGFAIRHCDASCVENLQEDVQHTRMGFLNLVKKSAPEQLRRIRNIAPAE